MEIVKILVQIINLVAAIALIVLVLLQHGKGADAGAAFGSGSSSASLFGAAGAGNFLTKLTGWLAFTFFATCLGLGFIFSSPSSSSRSTGLGVMESVTPTKQAQPAKPAQGGQQPATTAPTSKKPAGAANGNTPQIPD